MKRVIGMKMRWSLSNSSYWDNKIGIGFHHRLCVVWHGHLVCDDAWWPLPRLAPLDARFPKKNYFHPKSSKQSWDRARPELLDLQLHRLQCYPYPGHSLRPFLPRRRHHPHLHPGFRLWRCCWSKDGNQARTAWALSRIHLKKKKTINYIIRKQKIN